MSKEYKDYLKKVKIKILFIHICRLLILISLIAIWQILSDKNIINSFITSSPKKILDTIINLYQTNNLFQHIWITTYETIISFLLGTIIGILFAIILWSNSFLASVLDP